MKKNYVILLSLFSLYSCNEKVSPELKNANSSTSDTTTPIDVTEYYFKLQNRSSLLLNYKLHKTGAGNKTANCEIKNTVQLSNDLYRTNQAANDITCFFEAEELSLYASGFSFSLDASPNTCEYVAYTPFSYFNNIPGDSSSVINEVKCTGSASQALVNSQAGLQGFTTTYSGGGRLTCGQATDLALSSGSRLPFLISNDADLCLHNYANTGENCDVGTIVINTLNVVQPDDPTVPVSSSLSSRTVNCGGQVRNCVQGPIRTEFPALTGTSIQRLAPTTFNTAYSKTYDFPGLLQNSRAGNFIYSNYRRNLASLDVDYISSVNLTGPYRSAFSTASTFNPEVMEYFSRGILFSSTSSSPGDTGYVGILDSLTGQSESTYSVNLGLNKSNFKYSRPLAADPFYGLAGYRVNPFYTFHCLDSAYETKARIRLVVREWDRVFPSTNDLELLSDINLGVNSRQDNPTGVEIPGDFDSSNGYNDLRDWDDIVNMDRTAGSFDALTTIWQPSPLSAPYTQGFFSPAIFPREPQN